MKKISLLISTLAICTSIFAQTEKKQIIENGGSGAYKAEVVADASLPTHTIYKPADLKSAFKAEGKLPVILYANGGCANNSLEARYFLNELASQGYIAIAIGPYDEDDFFAHWEDVMSFMYPKTKAEVVLANGKKVLPLTPEEIKAKTEAIDKARQAEQNQPEKKKSKKAEPAPAPEPERPSAKAMLAALDWITDQNADPKSEYYHMIDLENVAAMGQSCGGAMTLAIAHDPRIKTCVILNSGMGDMAMAGSSPEQLDNLHTPMFYFIGGPDDIAFPNAAKDYERINHVPLVMVNTLDGHEGTYYEAHGGPYAVVVNKWLGWQLKGKLANSGMFLNDDYFQMLYPEWTIQRKNF